jgi:broad specificity phosphatase PhoE
VPIRAATLITATPAYPARIPTILLIRHGQASYGAADYDQLSVRGEEQSAAAARELASSRLNVGRVVSGSLRRQRDTAAPPAAALGVTAEVDDRWNEFDMDDILAAHSETQARANAAPGSPPVSSAEFQRILEPALASWIGAGEQSTSAEPWTQFDGRIRAACNELASELGSGSTGLVFTSAGVIAALCAGVMGLPAQAVILLNRVSINAGITKLACGRSGISMVSFNEHAYLEHAGPDLVTLR